MTKTVTGVNHHTLLNGICPYFTMFPLDFPLSVLKRAMPVSEWVLDPFCGRGTTNYASRVLGLSSYGIDSSPVAVAISEAKLANASPAEIIEVAQNLLNSSSEPKEIPTGEFWEWAYHPSVLRGLCRLREGLQQHNLSDAQKALRGVILGALHGPLRKEGSSYFSNQAQRTYAPKPDYAVRYWKEHRLRPEYMDILTIISVRALRYFSNQKRGVGGIRRGDSRNPDSFSFVKEQVKWIITSPPYYGMRTYIPDQWLRHWFLGGPAKVDYSTEQQISHLSPECFAQDLKQVWVNVGNVCTNDARLVIRFGGINNRSADALQIIKHSLQDTHWKIQTIRSAGSAATGKRQAVHIRKSIPKPRDEFDVWTKWNG